MSPAAAVLRIELKVVGVAVKAFTKVEGGAAQPEYVPDAVAEVSNAGKNAKRKMPNLNVNFIVPSKRSNLAKESPVTRISHDVLSSTDTQLTVAKRTVQPV
jgi:hypothetical protein